MASPRSSTPAGVGGPHRSGWPLIGRDDVVDAVSAAIAHPGPGSLVLSGRPGVGRSRLAQEALRAARSAGFTTEWFVTTRAAASIPFGAFARLLDGADRDGSDRLTLFLSAVEALATRAAGGRLVLVVDDAHLLDQSGAAFLHQVAAAGTAFVVATVCTGEPTPEPIVALGRDGLGARLELPPLTAAEFELLLGTVLDGPVDGGTLHDLIASTRGDVSFLYELVAAGLESKALAEADGIWRWTGPLGSHPRLVAVVESRFGGLTADERGLLELLADSEPLELVLLERLVPAGTLESVERKGLLEVEQDRQRLSVRLAHPLHGEAIRAATPPLGVRALRRRLASALRDTGRRRCGDLLRYAAWRLDGGEAVDTEELLAAASRAASCANHRLAERLSRAAVAGGSGLEASRLLSRALIGQGRLDEADALLSEPVSPIDAEAERERLVLTRAVNLYLAMGVAVDADEVLRRAEAMLFGVSRDGAVIGDELRAELGVVLAMRALTEGRPGEALRAADAVLQEPGAEEPAQLRALVVAAMALAIAGRTHDALAAATRGTDLASRWGEELPQAALSLLAASAVAHRYAGDLAEAEALATASYRRTLLEANDAARTLWAVLLGRIALDRGRVRTAVRWFREATALSRAVSPLGQLPWCLANLAVATAQSGDASAAETALLETEDVSGPMKPLFDPDLILARAWTAGARGERTRAVQLALEAGDLARERSHLNFAASAIHDALRLGEVGQTLPRLADIVSAVDGRRAPAMLAHAVALDAQDGSALDAASAAFEEMGATLLAAEAATEAAAVHRRNGKTASSLAAGDRARVLRGLCEGATTPALDHVERDVLTRRERDVAVLAARGLSNREIADLLVVSVRTIENQLHRVYGKLALAGRDELAAALGRPGQELGARRTRRV